MQNIQPSNIINQPIGQPINQQVIYTQAPQMYVNQPQLAQSYYVPQQGLSTPIMNNQFIGQSPMTTVSQGFVTPMKYEQAEAGYIQQPQFIDNTGVPMVLDPTLGVDPNAVITSTTVQEKPVIRDLVYRYDPTRVEFGRIKGIQVLTFPGVELERTTDGKTIFGTIGNLNVLYFPDLDRFVLSLNGWKYPLLKRLPVFSTEPSITGPVSYTLPTLNGFYTLTIQKIYLIEALKNFETILRDSSRFSINPDQTPFRQQLLSTAVGVSGPVTTTVQDVSGAGIPLNTGLNTGMNTGLTTGPGLVANQDLIAGPGMASTLLPGQEMIGQSTMFNQSGLVGEPMLNASGLVLTPEEALAQFGNAQPAPMKATQRIRRGFGRFLYKITKAHGVPNAQNLNMYYPRDIYNIKRTTETMAPCEIYPKKEVERWVIFNKEIANRYGFVPEDYIDGNTSTVTTTSPLASEAIGRMRGYGSVDLGQGSLSNPVALDRITCERPSYTMVTGNYATVAPSGKKNYAGYGGLPSSSDKFRAKMGHPRGERYQSLAGPREMTINQGTVISSNVVGSTIVDSNIATTQPQVQTTIIQEPSVVQRLEEKFNDDTPIIQENYSASGLIAQSPMFELTQPIESITDADIRHLQKNYPGFVDMQTYGSPVTQINAQETYIQERPNLVQRFESGVMNDSQGVQNLSATFGNQVSSPENVVITGPYTQEATINPIRETPTLLQRVENKIATYENPQVQTVYAQPTVISQPTMIAQPTVLRQTVTYPQEANLNRDMQNLSLMDKMKGFFRSRKPAEEGGIPPEQLARIRNDGTLHHYQA